MYFGFWWFWYLVQILPIRILNLVLDFGFYLGGFDLILRVPVFGLYGWDFGGNWCFWALLWVGLLLVIWCFDPISGCLGVEI